MTILVDVIIILIIALVVWRSAVKGFICTVIELAGYIAAVCIAFTLSSVAADIAYENGIRPQVVSSVEQGIDNTGAVQDIESAVDEVWDNIPSFITAFAGSYGIDKETIRQSIENDANKSSSAVAEFVADDVVKPVAVNLIKMVLSFILFIILLIIVKILAKTINGMISKTFVGTANTVLGGVTGFIKGFVFVFLAIVLIGLAMPVFGGKFLIFTQDFVDDTILFKAIYSLNPLI